MSEPLTDTAEGVIVQEPSADAAERVSRRWKDWFAQARWLLFSFEGRINRGTFLLCMFLVYAVPLSIFGLVVLVLNSSSLTIGTSLTEGPNDTVVLLGAVVAVPTFFWINLAVTFKRLHDYGASLGMFLILGAVGLIPYIGSFVGLFMMFRAGDSGSNIYGEGPGWPAKLLSVEGQGGAIGEPTSTSILSLR
jgi:uncharacterized membrane protein YhaH (DUF805 family)